MTLAILFEDNHLLILDKPPGLATQPSLEHADSLETRAKAYLKQKGNKKGEVFLHAVHRLDKDVAGIVLFAKTSKALTRLQAQFREKSCIKIYHAEVEGFLEGKDKKLVHFLKKKEHKSVCTSSKEGQAQEAILTYTTLKTLTKSSLLEILLESGRYHQIRAQLAATGHPILGDSKYGSRFPFAKKGIALQHVHFECTHPVTREKLVVQTPSFF